MNILFNLLEIMKKVLIISTTSDISLWMFISAFTAKKIFVSVLLVDVTPYELVYSRFDLIYIRDLFNSNLISVTESIDFLDKLILNTVSTDFFVDWVSIGKHLLFEDKWSQYLEFNEFMPVTKLWILNHKKWENLIYKERISSCSKWIFFDTSAIQIAHESCITQNMHEVHEEYRVIVLWWIVLDTCIGKIPKTKKSKLTLTWSIKIQEDIRLFCERVRDELIKLRYDFDLIWLDIIRTEEWIFLLEINRSPQITAFYRESGINIPKLLIEYLLKSKLWL